MARATLSFLPIDVLRVMARQDKFEPGEVRVVGGLEVTEDMADMASVLVTEHDTGQPLQDSHYDGRNL